MIFSLSFRALRRLGFVAGFSLFILTGCAQSPTTDTAAPPRDGLIRVMTYNIRHGRGLDDKVDLERIAKLIKDEGADLVALQEVDKGTERTERRDLAAELAALTGLTAVFSNNYHYQGGEYGNAVLTRFPIRRWSNHHYQMPRGGEPRGLLQVTVDINGREVALLNTHMDYQADGTNRWSSVQEIETILQQYQKIPVILCGDFNDTPGSRVHQRLCENFRDTWQSVGVGPGLTIPPLRPRKRIDYIWLSQHAALEPVRIWVPQSQASDHLPVVAELRLK